MKNGLQDDRNLCSPTIKEEQVHSKLCFILRFNLVGLCFPGASDLVVRELRTRKHEKIILTGETESSKLDRP